MYCDFAFRFRSKLFGGKRYARTMSHNLLFGRVLSVDGVFTGGSDAEASNMRLPPRANDIATRGFRIKRRPRRRRREAFRDPLLQKRR